MKNNTKILAAFTVLILTLGTVTAINPGQQSHVEAAKQDNSNFNDVKIKQDSSQLDDVFSILAFSFLNAPEKTRRGEQIQLDFEVRTIGFKDGEGDLKNDVDRDEALYIVEVYECADSDCNNGAKDKFVEALRTSPDDVGLQTQIFPNDNYKSSMTYTVPSDVSGTMAVTSYLWIPKFGSDGVDNDKDNRIDENGEPLISDTPRDTFRVLVDSDGDGVFDSNDDCPDTAGTKSNGCPQQDTIDNDGTDGGGNDGGGTSDTSKPVINNPFKILLALAALVLVAAGAIGLSNILS